MNIYTTRAINGISLIITIVVFLAINFILDNFSKINLESTNFSQIVFDRVDFQEDNEEKEKNKSTEDKMEYNWYIEIKSINLKAPIEETIEQSVLTRSVGHFEGTAIEKGNIGVAAHNRGYQVNYFENLKKVKIGDEIVYKYNNFKMIYEVDTIEIIEDTDWSYLEEKKDENKITLITCVENEPNYRRCVQATEKE